jgi:hypothetical protein
MTSKELSKQIKEISKANFESGSSIEVNSSFNYVSIEFNNGDSYFLQDEESTNLINEAESTIEKLELDVTLEEYLIYTACEW